MSSTIFCTTKWLSFKSKKRTHIYSPSFKFSPDCHVQLASLVHKNLTFAYIHFPSMYLLIKWTFGGSEFRVTENLCVWVKRGEKRESPICEKIIGRTRRNWITDFSRRREYVKAAPDIYRLCLAPAFFSAKPRKRRAGNRRAGLLRVVFFAVSGGFSWNEEDFFQWDMISCVFFLEIYKKK